MKSKFGLILTVATSLAVAVGLFEAAARLLNVGAPWVIRSGWRHMGPPEEANQLGIRGQRITYEPDDFVVVLLGDSQVEALACAFGWMPERRLQRHLSQRLGRRVRCFSLAASGWGQDQQLLALEEYMAAYRADLAVIWETPLNDVWNNLFSTNWVIDGWPKPTFWLETGELKGPNHRAGEAIVQADSGWRLVNLLRRFLYVRLRSRLPEEVTLATSDRAWAERRLPEAYRPAATCSGQVDLSWHRRAEGHLNPNLDINNLITLESEKTHWQMSLVPPSPRTEYGLRLTNLLLHRIKDLVEERGGRLLTFSAVPDRRLGEERLARLDFFGPAATAIREKLPHVDKIYLYNGKFYSVSHRQLEENTARMNLGLEHYRLTIQTEEWKVSPTDHHLNQHAVDEVMAKLAQLIAARLAEGPSRQP